MTSHTIKIQHEKFGVILQETFTDSIQFKLFLSAVHGCIELKNDLSFFNGLNFFIHIPHKHLKNSIIITKIETPDMVDHFKSKLESLVTK